MKKLAILLVATAIAIIGLNGTATANSTSDVSVMGWPSGCWHTKLDATTAWGGCDHSNGGSYKVIAFCFPPDGGPTVWAEPLAWQTRGTSVASCPPLTFYSGSAIKTRAS
ncbi:hypothetical protein M4438_32765 [Streptomyces lavenduligriseus]|uniref:Secreted protein n=1 Tax=Streptomyces lavenduligriseus TaxID=67315 RepID=A0ABT0P3A4_9ACTN|nr:hypothetical protein [Streptomyces lavenduligriseus]